MALLYDSTSPNDIPVGVWAAGYCDGIYAWSAAGWAMHPGALRIAVSAATDDGDALDVENGDALPDQAPGWVVRRRNAGILVPWVYCNRSNRSAVEFQLNKFGIMSDQVALWVATLDGTQTVPAGPYPVAAVQYANATISGGHYDLSLVQETFGPGGGTIGGDTMDPANPVDKGVIDGVRNLQIILGYDVGNGGVAPPPADAPPGSVNLAKAFEGKIRTIVQQELAKLPPGGGGTEPPKPAEPKTITLTIPSVPGTATGTIS